MLFTCLSCGIWTLDFGLWWPSVSEPSHNLTLLWVAQCAQPGKLYKPKHVSGVHHWLAFSSNTTEFGQTLYLTDKQATPPAFFEPHHILTDRPAFFDQHPSRAFLG